VTVPRPAAPRQGEPGWERMKRQANDGSAWGWHAWAATGAAREITVWHARVATEKSRARGAQEVRGCTGGEGRGETVDYPILVCSAVRVAV